MFTADEFVKVLDLRRRAQLLHALSLDGTLSYRDLQQLQGIAHEMHKRYLDKLPEPSQYIKDLAKESGRPRAIMEYRRLTGRDLVDCKNTIDHYCSAKD